MVGYLRFLKQLKILQHATTSYAPMIITPLQEVIGRERNEIPSYVTFRYTNYQCITIWCTRINNNRRYLLLHGECVYRAYLPTYLFYISTVCMYVCMDG